MSNRVSRVRVPLHEADKSTRNEDAFFRNDRFFVSLPDRFLFCFVFFSFSFARPVATATRLDCRSTRTAPSPVRVGEERLAAREFEILGVSWSLFIFVLARRKQERKVTLAASRTSRVFPSFSTSSSRSPWRRICLGFLSSVT